MTNSETIDLDDAGRYHAERIGLALEELGNADTKTAQTVSSQLDELDNGASEARGGNTPDAVMGPSGGYWVTDYDHPGVTELPMGPFDDEYFELDPEADGNTGPWSALIPVVENPALDPTAVVATVGVQYQVRAVAVAVTDRMIVTENGETYVSKFYEYNYEIRQSGRVTHHVEPGLDAQYPGTIGPWEPITYQQIKELGNDIPIPKG